MASSPSPPAAPQPARRGLPPPCWSHDETLALIESYRLKWHSLGCSNLRAADWDDVASDLSRRSSLLPSASPKTSVQCRHKIEKLRKRFRSERLRSLSFRPRAPPSSSWPFFLSMESLDHPSPSPLRFTFPKSPRSKRRPPALDLASALRMLGDAFIRMERLKMDMLRETQRIRIDMELKRTEMILDSQHQILHALLKAVSASDT